MLTHHMLTSPCSTVLGTGIDNKAHWNQADEVTLINYLIEHKSEAGSGASFKQEHFQVVSQILRECTWWSKDMNCLQEQMDPGKFRPLSHLWLTQFFIAQKCILAGQHH